MKHFSDIQRVARIWGVAILSAVVLFATIIISSAAHAEAASPALVILSRYNCTMKIGQSFYLTGFSSNGKWVRFTSSSSRIASVNTYGLVTAKKPGTCTITGKVTGGEASCRITVQKIRRNNYHGKWFLCGSERTDLQRFCHHMEISKNKCCRRGRTRENHRQEAR